MLSYLLVADEVLYRPGDKADEDEPTLSYLPGDRYFAFSSSSYFLGDVSLLVLRVLGPS